MKIIVVVSNDGGMMFNHRRQSKDQILRKHILELTTNSRLLVNEYTGRQFEEEEKESIVIDNACLDIAGANDYVFVENMDILPYVDKIDEIIMYCWNRAYPSDIKFPLSLDGWEMTSMIEFAGNSHERITEKMFKKI